MKTHHGKLRVLVAALLMISQFDTLSGGCYDTYHESLTSVSCSCSANSCPAQSHGMLSYLWYDDAVVGQNGYTNVTLQNNAIGFAHPCDLQMNTLVYIECGILETECVVICGTPPVDVVGCLACISAVGLACFQDCQLYYCAEDTATNIPVMHLEVVAVNGHCVGQREE